MGQGKKLQLHFDIQAIPDQLARPSLIKICNRNSKEPFPAGLKYHADLLTGLNLYWVCLPEKSNLHPDHHVALKSLDPHWGLHEGAKSRLQSWHKKRGASPSIPHSLLNKIAEVFTGSISDSQIQLSALTQLIPLLDQLEQSYVVKRPLLYNFELELPNEIINTAHLLANLLFNVRALVLTDYNQESSDPAFESLRVDSVLDYLPKLDSVAADAALYSQFKRLEAQMPTLVGQRLKDCFYTFTSMGVTLVESIDRIKPVQSLGKDIGENLNRMQLDWLFGTHSGILYRLREELIGLRDGYAQTFHLDVPQGSNQCNTHWSFDCTADETLWLTDKVA